MGERQLLSGEVGILFYSETIKSYPQLEESLECFKSYSPKNLETDVQELYNNNIEYILKAALGEYELDKKSNIIWGSNMQCQLCGKTGLKEHYPIRNIYNNKQLYVGSRCIQRIGLAEKKELTDLIKEQKKAKIISAIPNLLNVLANWENFYNTSEIIIPREKLHIYLLVGEKIKRLFEAGQETEVSEINEYIQKLNIALEELEKEREVLEKYIVYNTQNVWVDRDVFNWIKKSNIHNKYQLIEKVNKTGDLELIELKDIYHTKIKEKVLPLLNEYFNKYGIKVLLSDKTDSNFILEVNQKDIQINTLYLKIRQAFIIDFYCTNKNKIMIDLQKIYISSSISPKSYNLIEKFFYNKYIGKYRILPKEYADKFLEFNEIIIGMNNKYIILGEVGFMSRVKAYLISGNNRLLELEFKKIKGTWMSKKEIEEKIDIRKAQKNFRQ